MRRVTGVVQHYAWGDRSFIPTLLGVEPDGRPWAELWLGTHANGPSTLSTGTPLADVTGPLPFLLKVLAAAEPLSLQTHPDAERARVGHASGRYPDPYAKPELLVALTPFEALCGIRPLDATADLLDELGTTELAAAVRSTGARGTLEGLLRGRIDHRAVAEACRSSTLPEARWVVRLDDRYPGDPSVAATLLMNFVRLDPGQAISLGPGNLHAYLEGAGIELMAASDNVVRGGLTVKEVDVDELLAVADPTPLADPVLAEADDYALAGTSIRLRRRTGVAEHTASGHELVVTTGGTTGYLAPGEPYEIGQGVTAFIAGTD